MVKKGQSRTGVAILCGGFSSEREVSLRSGEEVFKHVDRKQFVPSLIELQKNGMCKVRKTEMTNTHRTKAFGIPPHGNFDELKKYGEVVFSVLHGTFGEDGRIQALLECVNLPYTGSGVLASALAMDKEKTQAFLEGKGIPLPKTIVITGERVTEKQLATLPIPCVVKPNASGSSVGVTIVTSRTQLKKAIKNALKEDPIVLVQEYIKGAELTCGVLGNANDPRAVMSLPPVEIIANSRFFDYEAKYHSKTTQEICPARISSALTKKIQSYAQKVHILLGCRGLTRSDFILKGSTPIFLEINTLPGLTAQSLCPKEARAIGMSMTDFLTKQIELAQK